MKAMVISYSLTGNNQDLAASLAVTLGADHVSLAEPKRRTTTTIVLDTMFRRTPKILMPVETLAAYDLVVFVGPVWLGQVATPFRACFKQLGPEIDRYAFISVSGGADGLNPKLAGEYYSTGEVWDVAVSGDHAFLADGFAGLKVIDISDPTNPTLAGSYDTADHSQAIAVSGDHLYLGDTATGILVFDIVDPTSPSPVGSCDTPGYAVGVIISGDRAFVADYDSGLQVIDISDPTNPTITGSYDTPSIASGVAISGNNIFKLITKVKP